MNKYILAVATIVLFANCPGNEDCFEDPNLMIPPAVYGITLKQPSFGPTYIGQAFYPWGVQDVVIFQSINKFYSITRFDPVVGMVSFYWSDSTYPAFMPGAAFPFSELQVGETVTIYIAVLNAKPGDPDCVYETAKEIRSTLEVKSRVENNQVVGTQKVEQTEHQVPAGQYAILKFPIKYKGIGDYSLNLKFDSNGSLVETDTTDNNYTIDVGNLGM